MLGKSAAIGSLRPGKEADLIVIDIASMLPYPPKQNAMPALTAEDVIALCIYRGSPQANLETYVRGRPVYQAPNLQNLP